MLALLWPCVAAADFGSYEDHAVDGTSVEIRTTLGTLGLRAVGTPAFEVHYRENGVRQLPSFAIDRTRQAGAGISDSAEDLRVRDTASALVIESAGLAAIVQKSPVTISYEYRGRPLLAEETGYFAYDTIRGFRFRLEDDERILGGGQRVLGMDRRGQRMPLYNRAHYGYETESAQMYYSLPAVMSTRRYAIVFDNSAAGNLDIGHYESDVLQFDAVGGRTAYIVFAADNYPALIEGYTAVTGRQPLPPRWLFGNFASRYGYRNEEEVRDVVRRFRREDMPLDAVVIDLYWFGPEEKGHMGNLDWYRDNFPTGEEMIADFAADGVRTLLITEPFVLTTSGKWDDAVANDALVLSPAGKPRRFRFFFGETGLVDVFADDAREWFWQSYRQLFGQGVAGTWGDLGEPEVHPGDTLHRLSDYGIRATGDEIHNVYGHSWAEFVYRNQRREFADMRPVILMRSGFAGTQRYGIVPWTGDVNRSWGGFEPQVELALQMGLFGLGYTHSDLGGFAGGDTFDRELYLRWLQYGVFQPVFRPHGQDHIAAEPVFHDERTRDISRQLLRLRYDLLPYNYTLAWENSTSGMPLMRPVFFEDEGDPALIDVRDRFFWGDAFLVAPVLEAGLENLEVPLPDGVWIEFGNDDRHAGGTTVNVALGSETIPVFVRAGSFVPMIDRDILSTAGYSSDELVLHYYSDPVVTSASGRMYEDDGENPASLEEGAFEVLRFDAAQSGNQLTVDLGRDGNGWPDMPESRRITLVVHNWLGEVTSVTVGGERARLRSRLPNRGAGASWDPDDRQVSVRFDWDHEPLEIRIN